MSFDQLGQADQDLPARLRSRAAPTIEGGDGLGDRPVHFGLAGKRNLGLDLLRHRVQVLVDAAGAGGEVLVADAQMNLGWGGRGHVGVSWSSDSERGMGNFETDAVHFGLRDISKRYLYN